MDVGKKIAGGAERLAPAPVAGRADHRVISLVGAAEFVKLAIDIGLRLGEFAAAVIEIVARLLQLFFRRVRIGETLAGVVDLPPVILD
ncbi:MAG: hypothetical protein R3C58_10655 [Parvularculaceae bacterium]